MADGLLIGVDAGGTSTKALALDLKTGERREARAEGANWTVHGPEVCAERLSTAVSEAAGGRKIQSLALCIAGFYPPDHAEAANAWARTQWPGIPHLTIQPDVHAAWAGAFGGEPGIVVISGTGSIAYGRNAAGQEARAGGWGPLFGDEGSAYAAGLMLLRMMAHYVDCGAEKPVPMYDAAVARWPQLGDTLTKWLRGVYRERWQRQEIAALGGLLGELADSGDLTVGSIVKRLAGDLFQQALWVSLRLTKGDDAAVLPIALTGGFSDGCKTLRDEFEKVCRNERITAAHRLRFAPPRHSPLVGALVLAGNELGISGSSLPGLIS